MITKIRSCRILMTAGIESVICSGAEERPLVRLAAGEQVGTRFVPPAARLEIAPRKLWIALGDSAHGFVTVDAGAAGAVSYTHLDVYKRQVHFREVGGGLFVSLRERAYVRERGFETTEVLSNPRSLTFLGLVM